MPDMASWLYCGVKYVMNRQFRHLAKLLPFVCMAGFSCRSGSPAIKMTLGAQAVHGPHRGIGRVLETSHPYDAKRFSWRKEVHLDGADALEVFFSSRHMLVKTAMTFVSKGLVLIAWNSLNIFVCPCFGIVWASRFGTEWAWIAGLAVEGFGPDLPVLPASPALCGGHAH